MTTLIESSQRNLLIVMMFNLKKNNLVTLLSRCIFIPGRRPTKTRIIFYCVTFCGKNEREMNERDTLPIG